MKTLHRKYLLSGDIPPIDMFVPHTPTRGRLKCFLEKILWHLRITIRLLRSSRRSTWPFKTDPPQITTVSNPLESSTRMTCPQVITSHTKSEMIYGREIKSLHFTWWPRRAYQKQSQGEPQRDFYGSFAQLVGVVGGNSIIRAFYRLPSMIVMNLIYPPRRYNSESGRN